MRRELLLVTLTIILVLSGIGVAANAGLGDDDPCSRHPEDPRCSTTTTTSAPPVTTTSVASTTTRPPSPGGLVGPASCSNGRQSFQGYASVSNVDRLAPITGTEQGRGVLLKYVDPNHPDYASLWAVYDKYRPSEGYSDVGPIICLHNSEHQGQLTQELKDKGELLIAEIQSRDPGAIIHVMGLQLYPDGHVCPLTGPQGDVVANMLAAYLADLDPGDSVVRGPILSVDSQQDIVGGNDQCHLTSSGRAKVGQQLVDYFD